MKYKIIKQNKKDIELNSPAEGKENWTGEKYGVWKIISKMLDNPDENGMYQTTKCYKEIDNIIAI